MFQYAKEIFTEEIKKDKKLKAQCEQEKNEIDEKRNKIKRYDTLKNRIKGIKQEIGFMAFLLLAIGGLFLLYDAAILAVVYGALGAALLLPSKFRKLTRCIKEYQQFSEEEIHELRESENSMIESLQRLESKIITIDKSISRYEQELAKVSVVEEFENAHSRELPLYQADTKEEYDELIDQHKKCRVAFEEFKDEKVDYSNAHLEVRCVDTDAKYLVKK